MSHAAPNALFKDKVVWITGGGSGIGRSVALLLASRGAKVLVSGRNEKKIASVVGELAHAGGAARHQVGDVRNVADAHACVERAMKEWGRLDIVVASAGVSRRVAIEEEYALAKDILETNLLGTYATFHAASPHLGRGGRLISIASCLAKFGVPGYGAYCASKAGLLGLCRALSQELGPRGITANALCPGWVDTEMAHVGIADIATSTHRSIDETMKSEMSRFPLGRMVEPMEVAEFVSYLASPLGAAITGQALSICGGSTV